jgi:hypothetical protein
MLSVIMLSAIMVSAVMLIVVMLNVMSPNKILWWAILRQKFVIFDKFKNHLKTEIAKK